MTLRKNTAGQYLYFALVNASTGAALTGATVTGKRSIDGAAQGAVTGTISEEAGGQYKIALSQADTNGNNIGYLFTATGAVPVHITVFSTALDPTDAVRMGLTALPNAAAGVSGGVPTLDAALTVSALAVDLGTAQAGSAATITLRAGASATDSIYAGAVVSIYSGTGAGQSRVIISYVGATKVATLGRNWAVNPDATSVYKVHGLSVPRVDDNLAVIVQAGTGAGQLDVTAGVVKANLAQILGTALTETAGLLAGGFKKFFNISTPAATMDHGVLVDTVTTYTGNTPQTGDAFARLGAPAGASVSVDVAAVKAVLPLALVLGRLDASVGAMAANVLTAAAINADAITDAKVAADVTIASVTGAVGSVTGAVGSVTGAVGSVTGAVGSVTAGVTVTTNNDKTGYALSAAAVQAIWDALTSALTTVGSLGKLLVDNVNATISSRSSHSAADVWAAGTRTLTSFGTLAADVWASATRLLTAGTNIVLAKGVGVTGFTDLDAAGVRSAVGLASANLDTQLTAIDDYLDTEIAAIKAKTDALPASPAAVGDIPTAAAVADQVWDEVLAGHLTAGSTGNALNAAGAAGDPWTTALPGVYGAGSAGKILGDNVNATISSRATQTSVDDVPTNAELATALGTADDAVLAQVALVKAKTDNLPTDPADQSLVIAATDAIIAAIAALNNLSPANIRTAVGLASANLDTQLDALPTNAELATALAAADDAVLAAVAALNNLSQANVRTAVGLASANLDTQLDALPTNAELAAALATADDAVLAAMAALNNLSAAQVNAEVVDALSVDVYSQPSAAPAATASLTDKINWLATIARNRIEQTATTQTVRKDDGTTALAVATVSDDGVTAVRGEFA